ncbi:MAG TPA: SRPBCC family protein [Gemmatimonadales bacterium]|nr:SRPBCC family protein [Gemmatimonadales bacterium]
MQIEKRFVVRAGPEAVWRFLTDPVKVAGCLPGAAITGQTDDRTWTGTITVKVGPVATSYRGQVRFERLDPASRTAEIAASGQDVRGKGGADLRMTSTLTGHGAAETEVQVVQDISVTGLLAQMGRGMIQDVGDQLFERFTGAMRAQLEAAVPAAAAGGAATAPAPPGRSSEPIQALSFGAGVAGRALGRTARRPAFWIVVLLVLIVLWWLLH